MNRITNCRWLLALAVFCLLYSTTLAQPADPLPNNRFSEAHRFVFFAVLEGCYEDGLTEEAIDLIVPKQEDGYRQMTINFVYNCPLCCPAFDAFHTYSLRARFSCGKKNLKDDPYNTFGTDLDEDVMRQLAKPGLECRNALQSLIEKWVNARMERMRFTPDEAKTLRDELASMRKEGEASLKRFQNNAHGERLMKAYKGWTSCPICSGSSPMGGVRGPATP